MGKSNSLGHYFGGQILQVWGGYLPLFRARTIRSANSWRALGSVAVIKF